MSSNQATDIGIIVLAAGSSRRFGTDKRKAKLADGKTLLEATLACIPDTFTRRVLVLKDQDQDLAESFTSHWQICIAKSPEAGMANSLASGISMANNWRGALIALGDMPFIAPQTYHAVQQALLGHDIVVPCLGRQRGNPVAFSRRFFREIQALAGDQGARSLLGKYAADCYELETADKGIIRDIDTPDMLT